MKDESGPPAPSVEPPHRGYDFTTDPRSSAGDISGGPRVALVLGYLFVNKLVDISSQEDCALAHRKNCAAGGCAIRPLSELVLPDFALV